MKYNFDEFIDRSNDPGSYSVKWADNPNVRKFIGAPNELPKDRISYYIADMDYACPPTVQAALKQVLDHGIYGYSGFDEDYYKAVTGWFKRRFGWEFSEDSIYYAHGTHEGIAELIRKFTQVGEGVLLFTPSYGYLNDVEPYGRKLVRVPFLLEDGVHKINWTLFEEEAKKPENTLFIMIQPHNPTGKIFTVEELTRIGEICRANGVLIISDEVHIDLTRNGHKIEPVMKVLGPKGVISATAVNKTFNLAGLAMSNLVVEDPELKEKMNKAWLASPFGIASVKGAYSEESDEWVDQLNEYLDKCVRYTVDRFHKDLPSIKVEYPEATYVLWIDFAAYGLSEEELNDRIFNKAGILLGAGDWLDPLPGTQMRRMCVTSNMEVLEKAMDRFVETFKDLEK